MCQYYCVDCNDVLWMCQYTNCSKMLWGGYCSHDQQGNHLLIPKNDWRYKHAEHAFNNLYSPEDRWKFYLSMFLVFVVGYVTSRK